MDPFFPSFYPLGNKKEPSMKQYRATILLLEDDENLGFVTKDKLQEEGYFVKLCTDGEQAVKSIQTEHVDICLLDIMLPKMDGFTVGKIIKEKDERIPILFVTARAQKEDKIKGLKLGADDYITKPFDFDELTLRIANILTRSKQQKKIKDNLPKVHQIGEYTFNVNNQFLERNGKRQKLTKKETDLLQLLSLNINEVVNREEALVEVWGVNDYFSGRSMDVYISKIRKFLNKDLKIEIINIHGVGFKLAIE